MTYEMLTLSSPGALLKSQKLSGAKTQLFSTVYYFLMIYLYFQVFKANIVKMTKKIKKNNSTYVKG
jgi:hypothetical protein